MQELFAAGIARHDRAHRLDHVIVPIDLVDKGYARLSVAMRAGDDPVPDVRRVSHARRRRLFNQSVGKIGRIVGLFVAKRDGRAIRPAIDDVIAAGDWIEDRLAPRLAAKFELIPFVVIDGFEKLVRNVN